MSLTALTEKEREALRLLLRGHDAKSCARELGLSVHTINERLRDARRKLGVTSSREAARMVHESETDHPDKPVPESLGDDLSGALSDRSLTGRIGPGLIGGIAIMLTLSLALALMVGETAAPKVVSAGLGAAASTSSANTLDAERESAARAWLALVDRSDWQGSYDAAGQIFREPNTVKGWEAASQKARIPLGDVVKREAIAFQSVASPENYEVIQFRSDFSNRQNVIESVTLQREGGALRVVGYFIQ